MPKIVLVADDDKSFRNVLKMIIAKSGYEVITAENGEQAFAAASENSPDLIISDATMPVMDGYELLKKIRATESLKDTPFLLVTGHSRDDQPDLPVNGYVSKPPSRAALMESIQSLIGDPQ